MGNLSFFPTFLLDLELRIDPISDCDKIAPQNCPLHNLKHVIDRGLENLLVVSFFLLCKIAIMIIPTS